MQKTKLGITVGLLGAAMFFLGVISTLPALLLAGYVLLFEENEWLKKSAVKMVVVVVVFGLLHVGIGMIQDVVSVISIIINWITYVDIRIPLHLDSILSYILSFAQNVLLIFMGFKALTLGTVKSSFFDKITNKHM